MSSYSQAVPVKPSKEDKKSADFWISLAKEAKEAEKL